MSSAPATHICVYIHTHISLHCPLVPASTAVHYVTHCVTTDQIIYLILRGGVLWRCVVAVGGGGEWWREGGVVVGGGGGGVGEWAGSREERRPPGPGAAALVSRVYRYLKGAGSWRLLEPATH